MSPRPSGTELVYGLNPVRELLLASPGEVRRLLVCRRRGVEELRALAARAGIPVEQAERGRLSRLAGTEAHQGVVALCRPFRYAELEEIVERWRASGERALILALDGIQDPGNLGSLLRSAEACGAHGVIIPRDRACGVTPAAVKASAGAARHLPVARVTNLSAALRELKRAGLWVVGTDAAAPTALWQLDASLDLVVVIGGEGTGMRPLVARQCDLVVSIPLRGRIGSLNAAVAGAVVMFEILRQRALSATAASGS